MHRLFISRHRGGDKECSPKIKRKKQGGFKMFSFFRRNRVGKNDNKGDGQALCTTQYSSPNNPSTPAYLASTTPSCLRKRNKSKLELALEHGDCDPWDMKAMLDSVQNDPVPMESFNATGFVLDLPKAQLLCRILPFCNLVQIKPTSYTFEGICFLLNHLQDTNKTSPHLQELKLLQLPSEVLASCADTFCQALQCLVQHYPSLQVLRISLHQPVANPFQLNGPSCAAGRRKQNNDSLCFLAIQKAFSRYFLPSTNSAKAKSVKPALQELELIDFFVKSSTFLKLLANAANPSVLRIRRFRIVASPQPQIEENGTIQIARDNHDWKDASVQGLALTGCAIAAGCVDEILQGVASLPKLKHLTLSAWKHVGSRTAGPLQLGGYNYEAMDITDTVNSMLHRHMIESIVSVTAFVEMPRLVGALCNNQSLRVLRLSGRAGSPVGGGIDRRNRRSLSGTSSDDYACLLQVLQERNTTLQEVPRVACPLVHYYVDLNRHGRKDARNVQTTREIFVGLLVRSFDEASNYAQDHHFVSEQHHDESTQRIMEDTGLLSRTYGLLRENPNLWSSLV